MKEVRGTKDRSGDLTRRGFLAGVAASATGCASASAAGGAKPLRFCAFADIHYCPGVFPHDSRAWLERILARAERTDCDMIIHMGDFCHGPAKVRDYVDFYNDFRIRTYHTIGNHDDDGNSHEETLAAYRLEKGYYHFDRGGFRFVVTDTNHFERDGEFIHYSKANYHMFWKADQADTIRTHRMSDTRVPPEQLEWMKDVIENSPYPCIVTSHASYERSGACKDGEAVRRIFDEANARHPGRVRLVINGHHHHDNVRILGNVVYLDLNSASYDWFKDAHKAYPADYKAKWRLSDHTIMWDDPVSAIITISPDGHLRVEGQRSRFNLGITPEKAGYGLYDDNGRPTTPDIQSFELTQHFTA